MIGFGVGAALGVAQNIGGMIAKIVKGKKQERQRKEAEFKALKRKSDAPVDQPALAANNTVASPGEIQLNVPAAGAPIASGILKLPTAPGTVQPQPQQLPAQPQAAGVPAVQLPVPGAIAPAPLAPPGPVQAQPVPNPLNRQKDDFLMRRFLGNGGGQ